MKKLFGWKEGRIPQDDKHWQQCSRGFSLIELMVVLVIIGILSAVAIPLYFTHINRARIVNHIYPGLHAIETNITLYYAMQNKMPGPAELPLILEEANTDHFNVMFEGTTLKLTVNSPTDLTALHGDILYARPDTVNERISSWRLSGNLADRLGISE